MVKIEDFFLSTNTVSAISEEEYRDIDLLIDMIDAISRTTYHSLYIIDYFKRNFLYVSANPLFLCGHTAEEVKSLGYSFYIDHVSEEEQSMLIKINKAGFDFYSKIPINERMKYTISYNFHLKYGKNRTLIEHKLTPIKLVDDGKIWLAACAVSLASRGEAGCIEMRKTDDANFWKYSMKDNCWTKEQNMIINEKEKKILSLSCQGYSMDEIAGQVHLSVHSIKFYRQKLFEKLNVKNITEAIAFASNHKLF